MPSWRTQLNDVPVQAEGLIAADWAEMNLAAMRGGLPFFPNEARSVATGGATNTTFDVPADFAEELYLEIKSGLGSDREFGAQSVWYNVFVSGSAPVNVSAELLPTVNDVTVTAGGQRPAVSWTTGEGEASADVGILRVYWLDDANRQRVWTAFLDPQTPGAFSFPKVADEFFTGRPEDTSDLVARVGLLEREDIADYEAFRTELPVDKVTATPGQGRVRFSISEAPTF